MDRYLKRLGAKAADKLADRIAQYVAREVAREAADSAARSIEKLTDSVARQVADSVARQVADSVTHSEKIADNIAYRVALELINHPSAGKKPHELFSGISDEFWFWLCTEGSRRNASLKYVLPGMPDEDVQLQFTGDKGDTILREGFLAYKLFRELYENHVGPIAQCRNILDYGCGWGRIIRFFLKDVEPAKIWGVDPVAEMIELCRQQNRWCNFKHIETKPPTPFPDDMFSLIYSFSVFSHLSEEMHLNWLTELSRILQPGGILIATTRSRDFIEYCAELRKREDLASIHEGPRSSASAFLDTQASLAEYDSGQYCYSHLIHDRWSYWGDTAIPKDYVLRRWTQHLTFLDYIDDPKQCVQSVIVMKKRG